MNTKKQELEREAVDLQQQADQLKARRQNLQSQLESATLEHANKSKQAGADLLDGKSITGLSTALAQTEANRTALEEAISQADKKIRLLEEQARDKKTGAKMSDFFERGEDAADRTIVILKRLHEIESDIKTISAIYDGMRSVSPLEHGGDQIQIMHLIFSSIEASFAGLDGMTVRLQGFENSYQPYLAKARAKLK